MSVLTDYLVEIAALTSRELKKWYRNPVLIIIMTIQPLLWIGLFGKAFNLTGVFRIPEELLQSLPPYATQQFQEFVNNLFSRLFGSPGIDYFSYMALGMPSVIVLFAGMSSGMSIVWDRRLGYLNKLLVAPIHRGSIIISKIFGGTIRAIMQALIVILFAIPLGLTLDIAGIWQLLVAILGLILLAIGISAFFISVTLKAKTWESQMAIMNLLNLPIMFTSSVLYPLSLMPSWLQKIAKYNPLTYSADLTRNALLYGPSAENHVILKDFAFLLVTAVLLVIFGILVSSKALKME